MTAGQYDERELDEAIGGLGRVVAGSRLSPRDRDISTTTTGIENVPMWDRRFRLSFS
jgi:hypothetical protein